MPNISQRKMRRQRVTIGMVKKLYLSSSLLALSRHNHSNELPANSSPNSEDRDNRENINRPPDSPKSKKKRRRDRKSKSTKPNNNTNVSKSTHDDKISSSPSNNTAMVNFPISHQALTTRNSLCRSIFQRCTKVGSLDEKSLSGSERGLGMNPVHWKDRLFLLNQPSFSRSLPSKRSSGTLCILREEEEMNWGDEENSYDTQKEVGSSIG